MDKPIVVYAEDTEGIRIHVAPLLEKEGFDVHAHADGSTALAEIIALTAEGKSPLLLTDLSMPRMNGIELVGALAVAGILLPTVLISSDPDAKKRVQSAGVRVDVVMDKTNNVVPIAIALRTAARKFEARQKLSPIDHAERPAGENLRGGD